MRSRVGTIGLVAVMVSLAFPASGAATPRTFGSNLIDAFFTNLNCIAAGGCTVVNGVGLPAVSTATGGLNSPISGVVTRWRIKTGPTTVPTAFRVLRPGNSNTRTGVGTGPLVTPPVNATTTYDIRLPIVAGDGIGVNATTPPLGSATGANLRFWSSPMLADGAPPTASGGSVNLELLVNADVEIDADEDGYGDDTQDGCPASAVNPGAGCLLTVQTTSGGKITGPGINCPGDCAENYPQGTNVALIRDPDPGFVLSTSSFGPPCSGPTSRECNVFMTGDLTVDAKFVDVRPPDTTITKGPKKKSTKRKVKFKFRSNEPGSTFACALDVEEIKGKGQACTSPYKTKVAPGKHVFLVKARDSSRNTERKAAVYRFKVTG